MLSRGALLQHGLILTKHTCDPISKSVTLHVLPRLPPHAAGLFPLPGMPFPALAKPPFTAPG